MANTTKKIVLGLLSMVMVLCLAMVYVPNVFKASAAEEKEPDLYINFSDVKGISKIDDTIELSNGQFILSGSETSFMNIDGNSKGSDDGITFSQRLKMEGINNGMYRTVSFFLEKKAAIKVYAYSGSSGDSTRKLNLYKNGYNKPNGEPEIVNQSPELPGSGNIRSFTWNTTEAGSYYIAQAQTGGVNIYCISIVYTGEADPIQRAEWSTVANPTLGTPTVSEDGVAINVPFTGVIGNDGADYALVHMYKEGGEEPVATRRYLAYGNEGSISFKPANSGKYSFKVELVRKGETSKFSEQLTSVDFTYNLYVPGLRAKTVKDGEGKLTLQAIIAQVTEADTYSLTWKKSGEEALLGTQEIVADPASEEVSYVIPNLEVGGSYDISVTATRNATSETTEPASIVAIVRNDVEKDWQFRFFGASTKESINFMSSVGAKPNFDDDGGNIYDGLKLTSCSYDPDKNIIGTQGGKFTYGFFDGISYYYTPIKAAEEDFVLRSKITVEYINAAGNGQEGFALLIRDSIGEHASNDYFYTNSVAAISTKVQQRAGTGNITVKPGIGARFVTGLKSTTDVSDGKPVQKMYLFDKTMKADKGLEFVFEVEKRNNVYFARYLSATGELITEKALYHTETVNDNDPSNDTLYDPLCQIDKENVYVGFAAARGCVATFTDIDFKVTPRSQEYIEIKPEPLIATSTIASPTTSSLPQYNFKFYANSDGVLDVYLNDDGTKDEAKHIIKKQEIKADIYFEQVINLTEANNKFETYFVPTEGWKSVYGEPLDFYDEQVRDRLVSYKSYGQPHESLIVAPTELATSPSGKVGKANNDGTYDSPLDLQTALNYVLPGQTILMLEGTYVNTGNPFTVEKGNDGEPGKVKTLRSHPANKTRPVLDFMDKGYGVTLWGNYWHFYGFDITNTADGKKGLQVGAKYCVIENINAYNNGDSGIQVSGKSTDLPQFWPSNNLILNCTSYMNADRAHEDADGFGAKLYCGGNNIFRGCLAYCNADDGWDLYAKTESGAIGQVIIENCVTFGNGFFVDGAISKGNGNGFKLGGESMSGHHIIRNSISIANKLKGIDSNSCPDIEVYNCTSIYNSKYNYAFYTSGINPFTSFKAQNNISLLGFASDEISGNQQEGEEYVIKNDNNFFFYSDNAFNFEGKNMPKGAYNIKGAKIDNTKLTGWKSVDTTPDNGFDDDIYEYFGVEIDGSGDKGTIKRGDFNKILSCITRDADGSLVIKDGFCTLSEKPEAVGTVLGKTPGSTVAPVVPAFKDAEGNLVEIPFGENFNEKPQYLNGSKGPEDQPDPTSTSTQTPAGSNLTWLFVVLGVVVVAGVAAAVYFLVVKKKKAE